ncbi:winged helix-turn-helix domain-containing protein [Pseudokineococcus sp. 1T1Z-3]|uniref:winged helix-turn-helix domain-containing protein n=1 Tax=Pseudokineococcus sp. 1T1Z-3 TaxID=3132745 RepID=UPI0030B7C9D9
MDATADDLVDRLARVESRLAALEAERETARPVGGSAATDGSTFWALEGLRARSDGDGVLVTGLTRLPTGGRAEWQEGYPASAVLDGDWEASAPVLAALGHPVRLRLLHAVLHGSVTAAELTGLPGVGTSGQTNHHLRQLVAAGWLQRAATGPRGAYEVPVARVVPLLAVLAVCRR